ncbi:MAG: Polysaccharide biosynthesis protein CapD [Parcubacteria group bacterium GW2011_GWA1_47_8]|nr:MAG: Polysaccharide biosynthesis protein CapD [Parcubacteria group bacterium GW2011_GWA1_47_8]
MNLKDKKNSRAHHKVKLSHQLDTSFDLQSRGTKGKKNNVLIVGAGLAGHQIIREIKKDRRPDVLIAGIVDDDEKKQGRTINGAQVLGTIDDIPRIIQEKKIDQVLISTPSVGGAFVARVTRLLPLHIPIKVLPSISSVILGKVDLSYVRDIDPSDLIGRPLVKSDQQFISKKAKGKSFLVTGGAGSIGSEIVRQLYDSPAKSIIVVDSWEEGVFNLLEELHAKHGAHRPKIKAFIGNVRDKKRIEEILKLTRVDVILHAAAYKHVPLMEDNPDEARKTNYLGTKNMLDLAVAHGVKDFVLISTDKAVNPTSVMGESKRGAELLVKIYAKKNPNHRFCAVRFGNVLNSSGSIVPKFLKQIRSRSAVTITHAEMTRYFMSIPEAVSLVLSSWIISKNGQILLLDMGEPVKIMDLAINLIRIHGLEPHKDILIKETGIRPGEKIHEELAHDESNIKQSSLERIFIAEEL